MKLSFYDLGITNLYRASTLIAVLKDVNIYFNNNVKIDKTSLSLFAKENEVRSRILDLTKYDKINAPFEYRELLKDIYEEDDNLINVLFKDKKLDEELKFVKGKDTPTPKLSTPINNMRDLTIEELEKQHKQRKVQLASAPIFHEKKQEDDLNKKEINLPEQPIESEVTEEEEEKELLMSDILSSFDEGIEENTANNDNSELPF